MDGPSGFGFELTFRLHDDNEIPPAWPAELLQALARYVFSSGNLLCAGDHVSWHSSLDKQESRIQHMLLALDPELSSVQSELGQVQFLQVVGVTAEEIAAAQAWNGIGILKLMRALPMYVCKLLNP
jgi:suppressor of fused-like protein